MDTNVHETPLQSGSTIPELRIKEMDSISNSIQDFDEEKRFRELEIWRSDDNEIQSITCFRDTRSYNRWSSQFRNEGRYSGWPMRSNHSDVSNERWSRGTNRWENFNHPSRYRDDGYEPNTNWSGENSRWGTYGSYRDFDSSWMDRYNRQGRHRYNRQGIHRYNRRGRHGSYRVEDTIWSNEGCRNGRYVSKVTWSNDWHRQQINESYRTEDPTRHESYGNHRAEYMSWRYERNRQGRYGNSNVEYTTCLDGHHRQGRYGSLRVRRPGWANAHYRHVRTSSNRGENMSLSIESYRWSRYWNHTYPTRRRARSYNERCIVVPLLKDKENVESAATVSLPLAKTSNLALNLHEHRNVESQVSSRHPVSGEAASESIYVLKPISNGIVHSDLTTKNGTSSMKIGSGSCNIEGKSELEAEMSSELRNSDRKTISSFLKVEVAVMDERFENEQGQELEMCVSQSVEDNNVSLLGICSKNNPCTALEADTYSCMANKSLYVLHPFPERPLAINSRKKLLILDINGLLADIISPPPKECKPDICILRRFSKDHSAMIFSRSALRDFTWAFGLQELRKS